MAESKRFPSRSPNRAQIVQRFVQQTIRDVKEGSPTESAEYRRGWREACDACVDAFQDPSGIDDTLLQPPNPANVSWGDKREKSD